MINRISQYFSERAKPKNIFITVSVQLIFGFILMPISTKLVDSTGNVPVLDLRFGYSLNSAYAALDSYGIIGRRYYLFTELFTDIIYAFVYSVAFTLLLSYIFRLAFSQMHYFQKFNIFPFFIGIMDVLENLGIATMLINFPQKIAWACSFSSYAGLFKWGGILFNLILLINGIIAWGLLKLIRRR